MGRHVSIEDECKDGMDLFISRSGQLMKEGFLGSRKSGWSNGSTHQAHDLQTVGANGPARSAKGKPRLRAPGGRPRLR